AAVDNFSNPTDLGSGGGAGGAAGGGAVFIYAPGGTVFLDGFITANGGTAFVDGFPAEGGGGGAGGTINITADTLTGSGNLSAAGGYGGFGSINSGGGGAGGRILVHALTSDAWTGQFALDPGSR